MTPIAQQKFNTAVGIGFLVLGTLAWGFGVFFALVPNEEKPAPVVAAPVVDINSCMRALQDLGYSASVNATQEVIAFEALSDEPLKQLERASLATTVCKLPLQSFCIGEGCEGGAGLYFALKAADEKKDEAVAAKPTKAAKPARP